MISNLFSFTSSSNSLFLSIISKSKLPTVPASTDNTLSGFHSLEIFSFFFKKSLSELNKYSADLILKKDSPIIINGFFELIIFFDN